MAIKDTTQSKGFSNHEATTPPSGGGNPEASALATGLSNVISQQASSLGILAQQADQELDAIARPVAEYFGTVADGRALIGKVAQIMSETAGPADLTAEIKVQPPSLPRSGGNNTMASFFGAPKRISLPG